eukprot:35569-Hanusia_phi.AAC.2
MGLHILPVTCQGQKYNYKSFIRCEHVSDLWVGLGSGLQADADRSLPGRPLSLQEDQTYASTRHHHWAKLEISSLNFSPALFQVVGLWMKAPPGLISQ